MSVGNKTLSKKNLMGQYISRQPFYNHHFCKKTQPSLKAKIYSIKPHLEPQKMYKKLLKKKFLENATNLTQTVLNFFLDQLIKAHKNL